MKAFPLFTCLSAALALVLSGLEAKAESRHALVIGNDSYQNSRSLVNCRNDANAMAKVLEQVDFEVVLRLDADLKTWKDALREFIDSIPTEGSEETVALVYFAGHGVQIKGENYLIPVDAKMEREYEVPDETIPMDQIMRALEAAGADLNLLILDSCRNNPFSRSARGFRSAGDTGGLAMPENTPQGMFIAFSTSANDVAEDGEGNNSVYTEALVRHIPTPGKELETIFKRVGNDVAIATNEDQTPWFNTKFYGSFSFVPEDASTGNPDSDPRTASRGNAWSNSLGLKFVPVPGKTGILMATTETRVRDFRTFAAETDFDSSGGANVFRVIEKPEGGFKTDWVEDKSASWEQPGFSQSSDHPVVCVSWKDAKAFCQWLSQKEGRKYRLPTDAEWSAAASTGAKYPWGNEFPPRDAVGNYWDKEAIKNLPGRWEKSVFEGSDYNDRAERTARVASYSANRHGFFDLGGNVWEWCEDAYRASLNDPQLVIDNPILQEEVADDGTPHRVLRGASWDNFVESDLRTEYRDFDGPDRRDDDYGFRIVVDLN